MAQLPPECQVNMVTRKPFDSRKYKWPSFIRNVWPILLRNDWPNLVQNTQGYKVYYANMNRLSEKIMLAKLDGTFVKLLNQLNKISILILDDFGLQPLDQNTRLALLQILEDRYGEKSTMLVSQLPIAQWHDAIGEPTLADAMYPPD